MKVYQAVCYAIAMAVFPHTAKALSLKVFCTEAQCAELRVFEQIGSVQGGGAEVEVYLVDQARVFDRTMSAEMERLAPENPDEGAKMIQRLQASAMWQGEINKLQKSVSALNDALTWKLDKLPAYVCEQRAVVYGGNLLDAHHDCAVFMRSHK